MKWKLWLLGITCLLLNEINSSYANIVVDPLHTILVHPEHPTSYDLKSARILQRYLRLSFASDNGFSIVAENRLKPFVDQVQICLGKTHFADQKVIGSLKKYGYVIKSLSDSVICLYGNDDLSTLLATTFFLDSLLDIRFYLPGKDFVHCPKRDTISFDKINIRSEPFTDYVMATGFLTDFMNEYEIAECWGLIRKDWGSHQHTMSERFPADRYKNEYADIYPMIDSVGHSVHYFPKNFTDQSWQPDFSNPALVDAAVQSTIEYFKKYPKRTHIAFSVQDSGNYPNTSYMKYYFQQYAPTKSGKREAYTHAYVDFLNCTAERLHIELPKYGIKDAKTLVYIAYGQVRELPYVNLHKDILPITVYRIAESEVLHLFDSLGKPDYLFQPYQWKNRTSRIGHHDWAQGYGYLIPRIYSDNWKCYLTELKNNKLSFEYAHVESYPNWGLDGPKHYVLSKLLWNPTLDQDRLLMQFCKDMFGNASLDMYQYFNVLELLTEKMNNGHIRRKMWRFPEQLYLSENEMELAEKAMDLLEKASKCSISDIQNRRLQLFKDTYRFSLYLLELVNNKSVYTEHKLQLVELLVVEKVFPEKLSLYWCRNKSGSEVLIKYIKSLNSK